MLVPPDASCRTEWRGSTSRCGGPPDASTVPNSAISVAVLGNDEVTREGAVARLAAYPALTVRLDDPSHAQVLLIVTTDVTDNLVRRMRELYEASPGRRLRCVLVANRIREQHVLQAVRFGLVSVLDRQTCGFDRILRAIVDARRNVAEMPGGTLRLLVDQVRELQDHWSTSRDLGRSGFTSKEIGVLRMLAEGMDTTEVAKTLNYSERTIKHVIHGAVTRLKLRNRVHAVVHAVRAGEF